MVVLGADSTPWLQARRFQVFPVFHSALDPSLTLDPVPRVSYQYGGGLIWGSPTVPPQSTTKTARSATHRRRNGPPQRATHCKSPFQAWHPPNKPAAPHPLRSSCSFPPSSNPWARPRIKRKSCSRESPPFARIIHRPSSLYIPPVIFHPCF